VQASRVVLAAIAYIDQGKAVRAHFAAGGLKARWILAWLAMLPPLVVLLAIWQVLSPGR
jgi:hypothetical protein